MIESRAEPSETAQRWLLAGSVAIGLFAAALDTMVNVALPTLAGSFDTTLASLQWIIIAFVATSTALSIGVGAAADRFGLERFFSGGLLLYAATMLLVAVAPNLEVLIALRVLQGVAAAAMMAVGPALLAQAFPLGQRGRALGIVAGTQGAGLVFSGFAGGLLIDALGWQAIFLGRLPFFAVALPLAWLARRGREPQANATADSGGLPFDVSGAVTLFLAVGTLLVGLNLLGASAGQLPALALIFVASAFGISFLVVERRARWPILAPALFRRRPFTVAILASFLNSLGVFTVWFIFPFFVADVMGRDARVLGLLLGTQGLAMALAAPVGGWLADHVRPQYVMTAAGLCVAAGLGWISRLDASASVTVGALPLLLTGAGQGALGPAARTLVFDSVPRDRFGSASGVLNLGRSMGLVISVAVFSAIFSVRQDAHLSALLGQGLSEGAAQVPAHVQAFRETFLLAALVALAGAASSLLARKRQASVVDWPAPTSIEAD